MPCALDIREIPTTTPLLVRAAAASAATVIGVRKRRGGHLVLRLERAAAAAGRDHVGGFDLEAGAGQAVDVVDAGALEVGQAEAVDDHAHAVVLPGLVVRLRRGVESERVLEARAAPALDRDAERTQRRITFCGD